MSNIDSLLDTTLKQHSEKGLSGKKFEFRQINFNPSTPITKVNSKSTIRGSFLMEKREITMPDLEEVVRINKRINVLQQRKRYILQFYESCNGNRKVLVNQFYNDECGFYKECISQNQANWKIYEGQVVDAQFDGVGNLKFRDTRVHGQFKKGLAHGKISIFEGQKMTIGEYENGELKKIIFRN